MHYHNAPRGPCIKLDKDKDMINVIDKVNNLGIISRIVSHRFVKRIASKTQINDVYFLLSGLAQIKASTDAKMHPILPSMDGDGRRVTSHLAATIIRTLTREAPKTCHELAKCSCKTKFLSRSNRQQFGRERTTLCH